MMIYHILPWYLGLYPNAGSGQRLAGSKSLWLEKTGNYGSIAHRIHGAIVYLPTNLSHNNQLYRCR